MTAAARIPSHMAQRPRHDLKVRHMDFSFDPSIPTWWYDNDPFKTLLLLEEWTSHDLQFAELTLHFTAPAAGKRGYVFGNADPKRGRGGDPADGFPRTAASAARPGTDAVFGLVGVVGMGRAKLGRHLGVGVRPVVLVLHPHADGRAERLPFERAGKDGDLVGLFARGGDLGLTRAAAIQLRLDIGLRDL